jgi:predicted  nucleic acid-binding Zn-ribbon protein
MDEKLRTLYQIQLKDTAIDKIHLQRGELPLEVQDMEDEVEGLKTRIANAEADIADIEKKQAELRHAIQEAGLLIEKYSKQQDNVKNNREYESLGKEIEYQSLEQQVCEKRIGECERALAEKRALIDDTKARLAIFEANLEEKKKELEVIIEETAAAEEKFQAEKAELEKKIDERMLVAYNRVRGAAKNHLAVVTIEREACGGCFNQIPPQRKLDIIQGKKIIVCEYCGRILVNPEYKNDYKTEEA